jgi:hypothetical protein
MGSADLRFAFHRFAQFTSEFALCVCELLLQRCELGGE